MTRNIEGQPKSVALWLAFGIKDFYAQSVSGKAKDVLALPVDIFDQPGS